MVIGGAGLVGSAMATRAARAGHDVTVVRRGAPVEASPAGVAVVRGTIGSGVLSNVVEDGDILVLCHGTASPRAGGPDADALLDQVDASNADVAAAVRGREGVDVIFFSSGGTIYAPSDAPLTEDSPLAPESPYAKAKLHEEAVLLALNETDGITATALRASTVFGLRPGGSATHGLVEIAAGRLRAGQPVRLFGDGTVRRGYLWNHDLARLVLGIAEAGPAARIYNVCSEQYLSGVDVVTQVAVALDVEALVELVDVADRDVLLSTDRLRSEVGPTFTPFDEALESMFGDRPPLRF